MNSNQISQSETQWVRATSSPIVPFEPVTIDEARQQCNLGDNTAFDSILLNLIQVARETVEIDTGIIAATGTFTRKYSEWPCTMQFDLRGIRPVSSVTSIVYTATDGTSTTYSSSNYSLDNSAVVPCVNLTWLSYWPAHRWDLNSITVTIVAGYATAAAVPAMFKQACLTDIARRFEDRTGDTKRDWSMAYESLINKLGRATYP